VELTYRYIFAFKLTLRSQQPDNFPIICHRQIATGFVTPVPNLPQVSTILAKLVANFAAGVVETGGAPYEYLHKFSKQLKTVLMEYPGAEGETDS
jgi:hypothetical protein